ncbi:MAG: exodeoxyribonuclease VII large subunit [Alphaproteobacteria bacterium]|nr:exodeoxyribonuclease VII large subunit [Alphaproteobacteria bacterium]
MHDIDTNAPPKSNVPEFSVGELAFSLKKTLEDNFGRVRVRGELSRISIAGSGHMYSSLKDDNAVIDAVCWKGNLNKLSLRPEEGLEVICIGKISSYPKSSKYQLIIESMELAGEGALLKMLEDRRKRLEGEGLFSQERKKPLPFLPKTIGVVTSPTGAVIRDILHRLADRMPSHVLVWPVIVQGDGAANQITNAINGFNAIDGSSLPRPDILIVARGGGSLEDLMAFNEENVVRAAAESKIPIISAVGHETDTTLIDYAADLRAPTPTGAAEMAVPVRANLLAQILDNEKRLINATSRILSDSLNKLDAQSRGLGDPEKLLTMKAQSLDHASDKLGLSFGSFLSTKREQLISRASRLRDPKDAIKNAHTRLERWSEQLKSAAPTITQKRSQNLDHLGKMLDAYSFKKTLERGYAVIRSTEGKPIITASDAKNHAALNIEFQNNEIISVQTGNTAAPQTPTPKKKKPSQKDDKAQTSLF